MSRLEVRNLIIGIYGKMSHNLVMYRITGRDQYRNLFLAQAVRVLVQSNLPDEIIGEIIDKAMKQSDQYEMYLESQQVLSCGGSETIAESLVGFHCEQLAQLIEESSNANDNYIQEMQTVQS